MGVEIVAFVMPTVYLVARRAWIKDLAVSGLFRGEKIRGEAVNQLVNGLWDHHGRTSGALSFVPIKVRARTAYASLSLEQTTGDQDDESVTGRPL